MASAIATTSVWYTLDNKFWFIKGGVFIPGEKWGWFHCSSPGAAIDHSVYDTRKQAIQAAKAWAYDIGESSDFSCLKNQGTYYVKNTDIVFVKQSKGWFLSFPGYPHFNEGKPFAEIDEELEYLDQKNPKEIEFFKAQKVWASFVDNQNLKPIFPTRKAALNTFCEVLISSGVKIDLLLKK